MGPSLVTFRGALAASSVLLAVAPLAAQAIRLNAPLPRPGAADIESDFALSADGTRVVYRSDILRDDAFALFSQRADALAPPVRLNAPLVEGGDVASFALAGPRVVYLADQDVDDVFELFSVPIHGGTPVRVSPALPAGDVLSYRVTGDARSVVFLADTGSEKRLYRAPTDGSAPALVLDPTPAEGVLRLWWLAPDDAHVLFTRRKTPMPFGLYSEKLYALPLDGSGADVQVAEAHPTRGYALGPAGSGILDVSFSGDGQHLVYVDYVDDKDGGSEYDLYSTTLDGSGAPVRLNQLPGNYSIYYALSPTLGRVAYFEGFFPGIGSTISLDGSGRVSLGLPGMAPQFSLGFTPDGELLYSAHASSLDVLLIASMDGSSPPRVLDGPRPAVYVEAQASAERAFFVAREGTSILSFGFSGVYSVPLDGSAAATLLNGPMLERTGGGQIRQAASGLLTFRASTTTSADYELFSVPRDGSAPPRRISGPMSSGRDVGRHAVAPDGVGVLYHADQTLDGNFELFRTSVEGAMDPVSFLPLPAGPVVGDVLSFRASGDARAVVYMADQETDEEFRLFHVSADGRTPPTRLGNFSFFQGSYEFALSPFVERVVEYRSDTSAYLYTVGMQPGDDEIDIAYGRVTGPLLFTPDTERLLFARRQALTGTELVSATFDGADPVALWRVSNRDVRAYALTRSGSQAVYLGDAVSKNRFELFRVPVAGGAPGVRLHAPIPVGRALEDFRLVPDDSQVVFRGDLRTNDELELFVVPLEGTESPARRLSGSLVPAGDVLDYALAPDGARVVYRADALADGRADLFSVPLAPSSRERTRAIGGDPEPDVVQLTFLAGSETVEPDWRIAPDGTQVIYRSAPGGGVPRLYRVPLSGGVPPEPVGPPDTAVLSFELSSDKEHVVFLVQKSMPADQRLFSAPAQGGPALDLDPVPAHVAAYRLTPDGRHVVYACDRRGVGTDELYRVPVDGSRRAEVLSDPFPPGGGVVAFDVLADGRVVYRADQETDEVFELFTLPPAPRAHGN